MSGAADFAVEMQENLRKVTVPIHGQKIYKDECVYSFDNPESKTGLYVCLHTFRGIGEEHLQRHYERTSGKGSVYLHIKRIKKKIENVESTPEGPDKKITRLAIGVEGGFFPDLNKKKFEYEDTLSIFLYPSRKSCPWPNPDLPEIVKSSVNAVLQADSAYKLEELEALSNTWDGETIFPSQYAENLEQVENGKKVPPTGWKCEKCDMTNNLWLNLTDGSILCGRKYFDGSGGNDHAIEYFREKDYPLAVKLGTITKDGKADVHSYKEDCLILDPYLAKHLAHFGINIGSMEKTERTMAELELEANQKFGEWSVVLESGSKLKPLSGPGLVGLSNLGNSCYMNSVMQVVFTIPDFVSKFLENRQAIYDEMARVDTANPVEDFNCQMAKLAEGLLTDKYAVPPVVDEATNDAIFEGIKPQMFKNLIGKGHADFSSKRQQDAQEFFLHLVNVLERSNMNQVNPTECFKFKVEDRFECSQSRKVKYTYRTEYCLPLPIPEDAATNKEQLAAYLAQKKAAEDAGQRYEGDVIRPHIKLDSCLETFSQAENIEQFYSTAINDKTTASKITRLATFPDYLMLHLKKFTLNEDWTPRKLDVAVEMPDVLDLSQIRGKGLQPNEEALPDLEGAPPVVELDQNIIRTLLDMGFPLEACKKATFFTNNQGLEPATNWLMQHVGDSDFSDEFVPPGVSASGGGEFVPDDEALTMIISLGFSRAQAVKALKETNNSVERAADWVFSHHQELMELDAPEAADGGARQPAEPHFRDGGEKYQLVAFISHMGTSTMVGHYVCHILKDGRWVLFNDEKVALSEQPPKELGYLYFYKRIN
ncbi:ubiquitin carboxyl-terminal hydrolase 5 [Cloeon dipterum]|uniref:ubiquitin carboxyl-terminal hydrolase 5 n=1 Tax=Cloeon dipterum TaxID=197152 RepID=UPI00321F6211